MLRRLLAFATGAILMVYAALPALAADTTQKTFPVPEQTWDYLDANPPSSFSAIAYSLGQRPQKQQVQEQVHALLDAGIASGFSAVDLERGILSLVKLGQDPQDYKKVNLFSSLYTHENLYADGLDGALFALMAYDAVGEKIPESARNAPSGVIDYVVSSQTRSGGFALTTGRDPDVLMTAKAITALAPSRELPYVSASVEKAIDWLSAQQNANATFSAQKKPNCENTASVLIALRVCGVPLDDPRFVKNNADLLDALALFENTDGGYESYFGESSNPAATELAVIARITSQNGMAPYLSPSAYPGYAEPEAEQPDPFITYTIFFLKFIGILAILYFIVIITPKLAKMIDRKRQKSQIAPEDSRDAGGDTGTFEIHIPMKAQVPDIDEIIKDEAKSRQETNRPKSFEEKPTGE
ncbi:prenyltransferase/squalene oxidase repeat-containing protein [Anaerotruncus rubiinfantis]|uniref:prenyltransferase/squalene oxidase repeat-containing protein n=1 Tax=Anaerotruncus rubiinfantis TaxID=1720200 RepID=UPI00082E2218|nr:prenyltransferase/squalene oxidase repeat-containing protein [Anaerotruncus rubiinfantis]